MHAQGGGKEPEPRAGEDEFEAIQTKSATILRAARLLKVCAVDPG